MVKAQVPFGGRGKAGAVKVANDPGGERWVRASARAVDMFLTDADAHRRPVRKARS